MENLDEIENAYNIKTEKEDSNYLKKLNTLSKKEEIKKLKNNYKKNSKKILLEYSKAVSDFLKKKNVKLFDGGEEIPILEDKKKIPKKFVVKSINLKLSFFDKLKIKWNVFKFKFKIKSKKFIRKIIPRKLSLFFLAIRIKLGYFFNEIKFYFRYYIKKLFGILKKIFVLIVNYFKKIFAWIRKKISLKIHKESVLKKTSGKNPDTTKSKEN